MIRILTAILFCVGLFCSPAQAQGDDVPYWASIRVNELNMRVGPSMDYKIDWVFRREGLPVKVLRRLDGWRLIEDPAGDRGWVVARFLTLNRKAVIVGEQLAAMRAEPANTAQLRWNLQPGVIGSLGECDAGWCVLDVDGRIGWVRSDRLWGAQSI